MPAARCASGGRHVLMRMGARPPLPNRSGNVALSLAAQCKVAQGFRCQFAVTGPLTLAETSCRHRQKSASDLRFYGAGGGARTQINGIRAAAARSRKVPSTWDFAQNDVGPVRPDRGLSGTIRDHSVTTGRPSQPADGSLKRLLAPGQRDGDHRKVGPDPEHPHPRGRPPRRRRGGQRCPGAPRSTHPDRRAGARGSRWRHSP